MKLSHCLIPAQDFRSLRYNVVYAMEEIETIHVTQVEGKWGGRTGNGITQERLYDKQLDGILSERCQKFKSGIR